MKQIRYLFLILLTTTCYSSFSFSQDRGFSISFTDSLKNPIDPGKGMQAGVGHLLLSFHRKEGDRNSYNIHVFSFDERIKRGSIIQTSDSSDDGQRSIRYSDTAKIFDLAQIDLSQRDSFQVAVMISEQFYSLHYFLRDLFERPEKFKRPTERDSLFQSLIKLVYSDLKEMPVARIIEELTTREDNLQEPEPDLKVAGIAANSEIFFTRVFKFSPTSLPGSREALTYKIVEPNSSLLLRWPEAKASLLGMATRSDLDAMIADAAKKHLDLMGSRGIEANDSKRFRFTLKELVQTLQSWQDKKVGLLLYSLDSLGLRIFYANNSSKIDTINIKMSKKRLDELAVQLQSILFTGQVSLKQPSDSRGLKPLSLQKATGTDSIVNIISKILLPEKFRLQDLDHLFLVPTYNIGSFPYSMLKLKDSLLVVDRMSYSIVPSINEFIITGQSRIKHYEDTDRSKFQIMDNLVYWTFKDPVLFIGFPDANKVGSNEFASLPGTKLEITELSKKVSKPILLMGKDAKKEKVIEAMPGANIIYFATHAIADPVDPLNESFILLSGKDKAAMLTAKQIQELDLQAALVVLSACETGLGRSHEGGMIGLARAFEIAGAKNVLMSLWPVSDSKTPKLMNYFFDEMRYNGKGQVFFPHEAFRRAMQKFKNQFPDPVHWAAFAVFGLPL